MIADDLRKAAAEAGAPWTLWMAADAALDYYSEKLERATWDSHMAGYFSWPKLPTIHGYFWSL